MKQTPPADQAAMLKPTLSGMDTSPPARRTTAVTGAPRLSSAAGSVAMSSSFGPKAAQSKASATAVVPAAMTQRIPAAR